VNFSQ